MRQGFGFHAIVPFRHMALSSMHDKNTSCSGTHNVQRKAALFCSYREKEKKLHFY